MRQDVVIIGGGLAGSEAAWQAANQGAKVTLYEMRPKTATAAHKTEQLAEIVCSNSLGSNDPFSAPGILKQEMRQLGSLIIKIADEVAVPAGAALAVDREQFAQKITQSLNMSAPTLRRRLKKEGATFQQLKDECRRDASMAYLSNPELSINAVAALMGFTDPSAFHRSFKKWTQQTPGQFRASRRPRKS